MVIGVGTLVANGAGTAQAVSILSIQARDTVLWMRMVNGGAPGLEPTITITPGTGFGATFAVGDTSTYNWRVIR